MNGRFLTIQKAIVTILLVFSTLLTTACGKSEIKRSRYASGSEETEAFSTAFFTDCSLPYARLTRTDVENTPDEYLFYIEGGIVYRTLNDYDIVITKRENLRETQQEAERKRSGELYALFEDDSIDMLKIAASGEYAMLTLPATIPDWENDSVVALFLEYAGKKQKEVS